jgi:galactokinase
MSIAESDAKSRRISQLVHDLARLCGQPSAAIEQPLAFWIPGRIEVLGKHTDYGGGRSLLCAVERGICLVTSARTEHTPAPAKNTLRILDANSGEIAELELSPDIEPVPGHWSNYPITVVRRIAMNFPGPMRGADIVFASDLPPAAGVSSSSALVVAFFLALSAINDLPARQEYRDNIHTPEDLAGYLGCVENGLDFKSLHGRAGVGTFGGSEDQTAILCARPNSLVQYSFCPVTFERAIPLSDNLIFVIAASGVLAEKTGSALELYNRVSRRLSIGLECWNRATGRTDPSMGSAIATSPDARARIRDILGAATNAEYPAESLVRRFEQFDSEVNEIIPSAADALARGDVAAFGAHVAESQRGAERALENQIPETVALVRLARSMGADAASAFGAGFGGSVWALVDSSAAEGFQREWMERYHRAFPERADRSDFFVTRAGPAATAL